SGVTCARMFCVVGMLTACVVSAMSALAPDSCVGRQTKTPFAFKDEKGDPVVPPWLSHPAPENKKSTVNADFRGRASFTHWGTDSDESIPAALITVASPVRAI